MQYSVRQISEEFNLTRRQLTFWEDRGLIRSTRSGRHRLYSDREREILRSILRWRLQQFTVTEIKDAIRRGGFTRDEKLNQIAYLKLTLDEIEQAIANLEDDLANKQAAS